MDSRHKFKVAAIRARIEFCEVERRRLLKMMTSSQIDLAWISERMDSIAREIYASSIAIWSSWRSGRKKMDLIEANCAGGVSARLRSRLSFLQTNE